MSGGVTLAGVATAVGAAASAASAGLAISNAMSGGATQDASSALLQQLTGKSQAAATQRSSLLATAGQSAGSPLSPGSVGGGISNIFGN